MAVEAPEDVERFGRQVAASFPGFDPNSPGFEAYRYGRIAKYSMGKGKGVPDPRSYVDESAQVQVPEAPAARSSEHSERRGVRIGRIEMHVSDEEPQRNRPQHPRHKGQRSSGRYRQYAHEFEIGPRKTTAERMWSGGTLHQRHMGGPDAAMAPDMWYQEDHPESRVSDYQKRVDPTPTRSQASALWTGKPGREGTYRFRLTERSARARYRRRR